MPTISVFYLYRTNIVIYAYYYIYIHVSDPDLLVVDIHMQGLRTMCQIYSWITSIVHHCPNGFDDGWLQEFQIQNKNGVRCQNHNFIDFESIKCSMTDLIACIDINYNQY